MKKIILFKILLLLYIIVACDKWDETADVSHISYLPVFEFNGDQFISIPKGTPFVDPGVNVTINGKRINWYYLNFDVDTSKVGIYFIIYYAENKEGFSKTAERIVAVTDGDIRNNDISGLYVNKLWGEVFSNIEKIKEEGLYNCEDVMGYPDYKMPGQVVDLGDSKLALLPGKGFFGKYQLSYGQYSDSTLTWIIELTDDPYKGVKIPVVWFKVKNK